LAVVDTLRKAVTESKPPLVEDRCFNEATNTEACKAGRNRAVAALRIASDELCQDHIRAIYGNETSANMIMGTGATLASGWATVSGALPTKTALSAISTFFNAERSLVNEVYFKDRVVTAITSKIRQARTEKASQLNIHYSKDLSTYPLMQALSDIVDYHYTCSFVYGLEKALEEGQASSADIKRSKLEQERQQLQNTLDIRTAKGLGKIGNDGIATRINAIDTELQRLSTGNGSINEKNIQGNAKGAAGNAAPVTTQDAKDTAPAIKTEE